MWLPSVRFYVWGTGICLSLNNLSFLIYKLKFLLLKYLSALLFGALLFASAGTFTSCKDYDDDINNLQEQINTINTTLSELKTLVGDGGVSSVTFDESTGVLTVVDAAGTKTYTIKTTAGSVDEVKITIEGQELKVNGETVGKVGDTVAVANGELTINGTATGIKVGEYAILDNQDAGTVTITLPDADGKLQTVVLAKASSSLTSLKFENEGNQIFGAASKNWTNICWNVAATDKQDWAGPKGAVKRNDLLVGQINAINVQVTPASFNLGEPGILSLKDSKGNEAPVKVSAIKNNLLLTRASETGSWMVTIEMGEGITADNIGTAFDAKNNEDKLYALCVNGEPVSNYDITINTSSIKSDVLPDATNLTMVLYYVNEEGYQVKIENGVPDGDNKLPLDQTTDLTLGLWDFRQGGLGWCHDYIYDSYITFEGTNKSLAEARGISAKGMSITTTAASAGTKITATVHYMDVTGKVATKTIDLTVATSTTASVAADDVKYVVMPTKITGDVAARIGNINITNLGKVFESIDPATRQKVQTIEQLSIVEEAGQTGFLLTSDKATLLDVTNNIGKYLFKANGSQWNQTSDPTNTLVDDLVDLATISLPVGVNDLKIAKDAKPGKYVLYLVAKDLDSTDTQANELFRIKLNVEIALPAFTDLYNKVDANWSDGKFVARITPSETNSADPYKANAILTMSSAYGPAVTNAETSRLSYLFSDNDCKYFSDLKSAYNDDKLNAVVNTNGIATLNKGVAYNGSKTALNVKELKDIVAYTSVFAGMKNFDTQESKYAFEDGSKEAVEAIQEAFTVTSAPYNAQVKAALQGVTLVNYANGTLKPANEPIQLTNDGYMSALTFSNGKPNTGFGFALNGSYVSAKYTEPGVANELGSYSLDGYALWSPVYDKWQDKDVQVTPAVEQANVNVGLSGTPQQYQVTGLATGESTTVTFTLTDQTGFNYPLTVTVVK